MIACAELKMSVLLCNYKLPWTAGTTSSADGQTHAAAVHCLLADHQELNIKTLKFSIFDQNWVFYLHTL